MLLITVVFHWSTQLNLIMPYGFYIKWCVWKGPNKAPPLFLDPQEYSNARSLEGHAFRAPLPVTFMFAAHSPVSVGRLLLLIRLQRVAMWIIKRQAGPTLSLKKMSVHLQEFVDLFHCIWLGWLLKYCIVIFYPDFFTCYWWQMGFSSLEKENASNTFKRLFLGQKNSYCFLLQSKMSSLIFFFKSMHGPMRCSVRQFLYWAPKFSADADPSVPFPAQFPSCLLCSGLALWATQSAWRVCRPACFPAVHCCLRAHCLWKGLKEVLSKAGSLQETSSHLCMAES